MMLSYAVISPCMFVVEKIKGYELVSDFAKRVMPSKEPASGNRPNSPNARRTVQFQQQPQQNNGADFMRAYNQLWHEIEFRLKTTRLDGWQGVALTGTIKATLQMLMIHIFRVRLD